VHIKKPSGSTSNMSNRGVDLKDVTESTMEFYKNNNETLTALNELNFSNSWSTNTILYTSSGSLSALVIVIVIIVTLILCKKNCKKTDSNVTVEINEHKIEENRERDFLDNIRKVDFASDTSDLNPEKMKITSPQFKK